jgi:hypothetical protein
MRFHFPMVPASIPAQRTPVRYGVINQGWFLQKTISCKIVLLMNLLYIQRLPCCQRFPCFEMISADADARHARFEFNVK